MGSSDGLGTEFESADDSPGLLLWRTTNLWQSRIRATLAPHGLTHVQFVLLASLAYMDHQGPITQKQLADHASTDVMMTSQVLRTLEGKGYIKREDHPTDRRAHIVTVTDVGRTLANAAVVSVEKCDKEFFAQAGSLLPSLAPTLKKLCAPPA